MGSLSQRLLTNCLIRRAASYPQTERILVHPAIKKALCEGAEKLGGNKSWLAKVRPYWGHHYHFHVRLHCPAGQAACKPQSPPPASHGCGKELAWWFSEDAAEKLRKGQEISRKLTSLQRLATKLAKVPGQCKPLLP